MGDGRKPAGEPEIMQRIPGGVIQVSPHPFSLTGEPGCRSISDDDLCAWCSHLLYRPGELSLCSLSIPEGRWPSRCDENGCTVLSVTSFNNPPENTKETQ
jgi:hypothetical protein